MKPMFISTGSPDRKTFSSFRMAMRDLLRYRPNAYGIILNRRCCKNRAPE